MRLSPDGSKVSFLRNHPQGFPIAMVVDLKTGKGNHVVASDMGKQMFIDRCQWANDERLLWVLLIIFLPFIGSMLYLFMRKLPRRK